MTNQERARRARKAYEASDYDENDLITNIYDLICDLCHLADSEGPLIRPSDGETRGEYVVRMGLWHYLEELSEEMGCEGHPAGPNDAMGVTVYCDGSCREEVREAYPVVISLEHPERPVLGDYLGSFEDAVLYEDAHGVQHQAPIDSVEVRMPDESEGRRVGDVPSVDIEGSLRFRAERGGTAS